MARKIGRGTTKFVRQMRKTRKSTKNEIYAGYESPPSAPRWSDQSDEQKHTFEGTFSRQPHASTIDESDVDLVSVIGNHENSEYAAIEALQVSGCPNATALDRNEETTEEETQFVDVSISETGIVSKDSISGTLESSTRIKRAAAYDTQHSYNTNNEEGEFTLALDVPPPNIRVDVSLIRRGDTMKLTVRRSSRT